MPTLDHLVYAVPDLDAACTAFAKTSGITPTPGGVHPGRGTHNALVHIGQGAYLEFIAPHGTPAGPLWMGTDLATVPTLTRWAVRDVDVEAFAKTLREETGRDVPVAEGRRDTAAGRRLAWRMTVPTAAPLVDPLPFALDWSASEAHPADDLPPAITLQHFYFEHPDPAALQATFQRLGLPTRDIRPAPQTRFNASLLTHNGLLNLPT